MSPAIPWHLLATCESLLSTPTLSMSTLDVLVTTGSGLVILGIVKLPPFRQKQKLITALAQQTCHDARGTLRGPIELPLLISVLLIRISVIVASVYGLGPTSWNSDLLFTILNSALGTWFSIMSAWTIIDYQALLSTALKRSAQESRTEASERGSEVSISRSSSSSSLSQSKELTLLDVELIAGHRVSDLLGQLERCTGAILDLIKRGTRITVLGNYAPVMTACVEYMELLGDVPQTALPPEILRYEDAKEGSAELEKPSTSGCLLVVPTPGALHTASLNLRYIASLVGTSRAAETMRKRRIAFDVGLLLEDACDLLAVYASETGGITVHHPFLFAQRMVGDEDCVRMCFLLVLSHIFESMEHGCNAEVVIDMKPSDKSDGETKAKVGGSGSSTDTVRHLGVIEGSSVGKMILTGHIIFFSPGSSNLINSELASFLSSNGWTFSESCLSNGRRFIDIQSIQNIVDAEEQPAHPASNDIFSFPKLHLVIISDPVSQCGQNLYEDALQYAVNVTFLVKNSKDVLNELAEVLAGTLVAKQDTMIIIEEDTNFVSPFLFSHFFFA
ncbi:hypothetical protein BJ742DRAFT_580465 [Cladochytrium replicatum]|nr:hypothetical protein BJ742DRAFT_580465 [Cladochytrium replicatum]